MVLGSLRGNLTVRIISAPRTRARLLAVPRRCAPSRCGQCSYLPLQRLRPGAWSGHTVGLQENPLNVEREHPRVWHPTHPKGCPLICIWCSCLPAGDTEPDRRRVCRKQPGVRKRIHQTQLPYVSSVIQN